MPGQSKLQTVVVTLVKSGESEKKDDFFKVNNPLLKILPGDQLEFKFENCTNPVIMIPVENIFSENRVTEKETKGIITMDVKLDAKIPKKRFPYMIYSPDTDVFAEGNSPPRMVLNDPEV